MLATRWPQPFVDPGWAFELKWEGVRCLLHWDGDGVVLRSRSGVDATTRYPELTTFEATRPVVLDGEIVSVEAGGRPSFERLQQRMNLQSPALVADAVTQIPISYMVFDVLYDGVDVTHEPLESRQERLAGIELPMPMVTSEVIAGDPEALWRFVKDRGIEGVVAKRLGSRYRPGERSADWRKISVVRRVRAVVGGFTPGEGGKTGAFGALLLGLWADDGLAWIGGVGSGFNDAALAAIRGAFDEMVVDESPFAAEPDLPGDATWVHPHLVALVQYKEWTSAGRLRAPSFKGFTDDLVSEVTWEREGPGSPG